MRRKELVQPDDARNRTGASPKALLPADLSPDDRVQAEGVWATAKRGEWSDWRWQLRNRVKDLAGLERALRLSAGERSAIAGSGGCVPVSITPYYARLIDRDWPEQPLRRSLLASGGGSNSEWESADPLSEDAASPVPGLLHRYPDRALFIATNLCPVYCRYCTRSRIVGKPAGEQTAQRWQGAIDYIAANPAIRDVLISGGDPLILSDDRLEWILSRLRRVPHVEILRLGTKAPAVLPQRITPGLVRVLRRYQPLWMSLHFIHPDELTAEAGEACGRLADAGIPLGSQSVLLAGVNDDLPTLKTLFQGLLKMRVRPYYLYQCDPVAGASHFRVPLERGLELMSGLHGWTTGYAVPRFVVDAPGAGKIPLLPGMPLPREGDYVRMRGYDGKPVRYPDPLPGGGT